MRHARIIAALAALGATVAGGRAEAVQTPAHLVGAPSLDLADGSLVREQRDVTWHRAPKAAARAWSIFLADVGKGWTASWDTATGVPSRIYGAGASAPGTVASEAAAESFARAFLARHIALLAPGSSPSDFVIAANDLDSGIRSVGFFQHHKGVPVVGGQLSFQFKNDRLVVIGSEALPLVRAESAKGPVDEKLSRATAEAWALTGAGIATAGDVEGPMILPLVRGAGAIDYRTVIRVTVAAKAPIGRWAIYLDALTGAPVARRQTLHFAQGTVLYNAPVRYPLSTRQDYPAVNVDQLVDGVTATSDFAGLVTWAADAPGQLSTKLTGPLVQMKNDAGPIASKDFTLDPNATAVWNAADDALVDAQLDTYVHAHEVKAYTKKIAPQMGWLNSNVTATVNIDDQCNAFSDGTDINFYRASQQCENTGRLADVVYHEFGHSFHAHGIIPGVGAYDGALGEGQADYLAATMTGDPATARGFFKDSKPLRQIDPPNKEYVWPEDIDGDIHQTGLIIAGALWDLRKEMVTKYGEAVGVAATNLLYYQGIRRASDIPSMYPEVLAADDDDGDLENGTPNVCEINAAFLRHGLRPSAAGVTQFTSVPPTQDGYHVALQVFGVFSKCVDDKITATTLTWRLRGATSPGGTLAMTPTAGSESEFEATIPKQADGTLVEYQVVVKQADGTTSTYPDNAADPWYQLFVGDIKPIYCTDFEVNPDSEGWTHGLTSGETSQGADDWQWGAPTGKAASGDPSDAFSGKRVFGNDLGKGEFNGQYQGDKENYALSPAVDVSGYKHVRLQYRRWLNIEDGQFDQATIYANDQAAWTNLDSDMGDESKTHHQDKEWRFQDLDVSPFVKDGLVQIKYELRSDGAFELGGWTLDDFCIVAHTPPECGDGIVNVDDTCDDGAGNSDTVADACRTTCVPARCGDGVKDSAEACDDGNAVETDACRADCTVPPVVKKPPVDKDDAAVSIDNGCGCRAAGSDGTRGSAWALLALAVPLAVGGRRRRTPWQSR